MKRQSQVDVAIYTPFAGPLYATGGSSGGAEVQSVHLARALAATGLRVRHIVALAEGHKTPTDVELVPIPKAYFDGGVARRRAAVHSLRVANARVYIQRSAGFETGIVAAVARATGRRFVFSSSSAGDFMLDDESTARAGAGLDSRATRLQYRLGLKLADAVVVQTNDQHDLAERKLGVSSQVIRSFGHVVESAAGTREGFLWVGALAEVKDPLSFVELARRVPEATFTMVGGERAGYEELAVAVRRAVDETPNLQLLDALPHDRVLNLYGSTLALVGTSWFEGFPNAYLEAWARGTPVLSLRVDPDRIIERHGLGTVGHGSVDVLAAAARALVASGDDPSRGDVLRRYVRDHHDPTVVGPRWAALVRSLLR